MTLWLYPYFLAPQKGSRNESLELTILIHVPFSIPHNLYNLFLSSSQYLFFFISFSNLNLTTFFLLFSFKPSLNILEFFPFYLYLLYIFEVSYFLFAFPCFIFISLYFISPSSVLFSISSNSNFFI